MARRQHGSSHRLRFLVIAALAAAVVLMTAAASAAAAPPDPTIATAELQTLLDSGPVSGYFWTVLGGPTAADQVPVKIPVTVQSIVPDGGPAGDLILFSASGTDVDKIGGIAHGMSGSPLYVDDGSGTDKLAGAVSYGDIFTTHNLGLATPIADMVAIEDTYFSSTLLHAQAAPRIVKLRAPVATTAGVIRSVVVAPSTAAAKRLRRSGAGPVMAPLTMLQINGLDPASNVYRHLVARLQAKGFDIAPRSAGTYRGLGAPPTLVPGGSVGVFYSTGDFAAGALGTVTYVDGQVVVAFGHPMDWDGASSLYLTTAWVQGVWSTTYDPYKLMSPVATVGELTQDRAAGVAGRLDSAPVDVPITSQATVGAVTKSATTQASQWVVDNPNFGGLPSAAAAVAMQRAADAYFYAGSAKSEVTIGVSDNTGDYQVHRTDVWSDPFDVTFVATTDIDNAIATLTSGLQGLHPKVTSVDFKTTLSPAQATATVDDVTAPGGLHAGTNVLTVTLLASDGSIVAEPVTLQIPPGYATKGTIDVTSAAFGGGGGGGGGDGTGGMSFSAGVRRELGIGGLKAATPPTLAKVVDEINSAPTNTDIALTYTPDNVGAIVQPIQVTVDNQDWVVDGDVFKDAGRLSVHVPSKVVNGRRIMLFGMILSADADTTVQVYKRTAGTTTFKPVGQPLQAGLDNDGSAMFSASLAGIRKNTTFKVVWAGDDDHLGATWSKLVKVK